MYRSDASQVQRLSLPHLTHLELPCIGFRWDCSLVAQLWPQLRHLSLSHSKVLHNEGEPAWGAVATCMTQTDAHSFLSETAQHAALATKVHTPPGLFECTCMSDQAMLEACPLLPTAIENLSNLTCLEALNVQFSPHITASTFQHLKTTRLRKLSFSDSALVGPRSLTTGLHPHYQLTSLVLVESR